MLRLKKLQNDITNAHEMGLPLINYLILHNFQGPMEFGIDFEKINFYGFYAEVTSQFTKQLGSKLTDVDIWLSRPEQLRFGSTTTFFRAVEIVNISKNDKVEEKYRYYATYLNFNNKIPKTTC